MKKNILLGILFLSFGVCSAQKEINVKLLQGKWQSLDDKTNFLIFSKGLRKEIAEGMDNWDIEKYSISKGPSNSIYINQSIDNKIVSTWAIQSLNIKELTLYYLPSVRGNYLKYRRVSN